MVSLLLYKMIAGILIFITSLIAVIYPIRARAHPQHAPFLELADAFASGVFLGAALFHMLPDAIMAFYQLTGNVHRPLAELYCAAGFLVLLFCERAAQCLPGNHAHQITPFAIAFILIVHSLIEGAALGVNTNWQAAMILFLAIIAHKGSESFALAITLNRSTIKLRPLIILVGLFSLMTPLGIFLGTEMNHYLQFRSGQFITAGFNAFAAGTFLYMSTLHHINHHQRMHEAENFMEFICLTLGLSVMAVLAWWG